MDDDVSVRRSLALSLQMAGWRVKTFATATEFLACPRATVPSCLVLDVGLPDVNGLEVQERHAARQSTMPIVFMSDGDDITVAVRAMKGGALEFLTKPLRTDELLVAVERALAVSSARLRRDGEMAALRSRYASLSRREREVMSFVVAGHLNKQVAWELGISEITVKGHRGRLMRKMMARSLPDLVRMAASLGIDNWTFS